MLMTWNIYFTFFLLHWRTREEAKELIHSTNTKANSTQNDVTHKLGERVQNINFWKFDLERTIQDMTGNFQLSQKTQFPARQNISNVPLKTCYTWLHIESRNYNEELNTKMAMIWCHSYRPHLRSWESLGKLIFWFKNISRDLLNNGSC